MILLVLLIIFGGFARCSWPFSSSRCLDHRTQNTEAQRTTQKPRGQITWYSDAMAKLTSQCSLWECCKIQWHLRYDTYHSTEHSQLGDSTPILISHFCCLQDSYACGLYWKGKWVRFAESMQITCHDMVWRCDIMTSKLWCHMK